MNLKGIHHVALIGSNYARTKHFYCDILGLPIINEHYRAERDSWKLDLQLNDGTQLEIFSFPDVPPRPSYPEAQGLRHLAFGVDALAPAIAELERVGVVVEPVRVDPITGLRFTFFADPDGLPLELYEIPGD